MRKSGTLGAFESTPDRARKGFFGRFALIFLTATVFMARGYLRCQRFAQTSFGEAIVKQDTRGRWEYCQDSWSANSIKVKITEFVALNFPARTPRNSAIVAYIHTKSADICHRCHVETVIGTTLRHDIFEVSSIERSHAHTMTGEAVSNDRVSDTKKVDTGPKIGIPSPVANHVDAIHNNFTGSLDGYASAATISDIQIPKRNVLILQRSGIKLAPNPV